MEMPILDIHISKLPNPVTADASYEVLCQATGAMPLPTSHGTGRSRYTVTHGRNLTTSSLYFSPKMKDHGKKLICLAENTLGRANATRELSVHFLPIVTLEMMNAQEYILQGEDLVLECHIKARPAVWRVLWYHNGKEIQPTGDRIVIPEEGTLLLRNVTKERSGDYLCSATNIIKISVYYKPVCRDARITKSLDFVSNEEVTTISLGCGVDAKPEVRSYRWLVNSSDSEAIFEIPTMDRFFAGRAMTSGNRGRPVFSMWYP
ncbi:Hemicentin1like [Caligus rogercresseyi]|uniref:Hemicentin1like n=1 Tax=Caligus rogercresseyi TaxID=217165 RepID=A0A7T8JVB5_CALRO|nr:Hemicentin1like [Caligus rogercresseyi]